MRDTTPEVAELVRQRLGALAPERRLIMAAEMFDTARAMVIASLPAGLPLAEARRRLCARLYGEELARKYADATARRAKQ